MASHLPSQCCYKGVKHDGNPKGTLSNFSNLEAYITHPEGSHVENGILLYWHFSGFTYDYSLTYSQPDRHYWTQICQRSAHCRPIRSKRVLQVPP